MESSPHVLTGWWCCCCCCLPADVDADNGADVRFGLVLEGIHIHCLSKQETM